MSNDVLVAGSATLSVAALLVAVLVWLFGDVTP